jgi:hypothetical protein
MRAPRRSIRVDGSAGRTTEVVREADADKARAGALGGLEANVRSTIRGASDDQTRKARDPVVLGISRLPIPSRLEVPLLGRAEEDSRGGSPQSLPAVKRTRRAVRVEDGAMVTPTKLSTSRTATSR